MRKLYHQNSNTTQAEQSKKKSNGSADLLVQTDPGIGQDPALVRQLEGKILLMEERNKSIMTFYENKITQLRKVLAKQGETKLDLMQELSALTLENQHQNKYVHQLKTQLEEETTTEATMLKQSQKMRNYQIDRERNDGRLNSRSRGKNLFSSRNFGKESSRIPLKKCKSSECLESEYFYKETETKISGKGMFPSVRKLRVA